MRWVPDPVEEDATITFFFSYIRGNCFLATVTHRQQKGPETSCTNLTWLIYQWIEGFIHSEAETLETLSLSITQPIPTVLGQPTNHPASKLITRQRHQRRQPSSRNTHTPTRRPPKSFDSDCAPIARRPTVVDVRRCGPNPPTRHRGCSDCVEKDRLSGATGRPTFHGHLPQ